MVAWLVWWHDGGGCSAQMDDTMVSALAQGAQQGVPRHCPPPPLGVAHGAQGVGRGTKGGEGYKGHKHKGRGTRGGAQGVGRVVKAYYRAGGALT